MKKGNLKHVITVGVNRFYLFQIYFSDIYVHAKYRNHNICPTDMKQTSLDIEFHKLVNIICQKNKNKPNFDLCPVLPEHMLQV